MTFRCKNPDNTISNVAWQFIKNGWVAAVTVCNAHLYNITVLPILRESYTGTGNLIFGGTADIDVGGDIPTVTTDSFDIFGLNANLAGTIVSEGTGSVTSYGFAYSAINDTPTISDHIQVVEEASHTGSFTTGINFDFELDEVSLVDGINPVWIRAYATNGTGTAYGSVLSGNPFLCLIEGTPITLANGTVKTIDSITYNDNLLVWNFDEGKLDEAKPVWIMKPFKASKYSLVKFSDGSTLGTIADGQGHSIFNIEKQAFTHMMSEEAPIGTTTYNKDGKIVKLISKEVINEEKTFYNIITNIHMNVFADNILTSTTLNNIYPIEDMQFVKDIRVLNNREDFDVSDEWFTGLRLAEQTIDVKAKLQRMKRQQL